MLVVESAIFIINDDHPYLRQFPLAFRKSNSGNGWVVRWVDFGTVSQEKYFACPKEAAKYCDRMNLHQRVIHGWFGESFGDCDAMWKFMEGVTHPDNARNPSRA